MCTRCRDREFCKTALLEDSGNLQVRERESPSQGVVQALSIPVVAECCTRRGLHLWRGNPSTHENGQSFPIPTHHWLSVVVELLSQVLHFGLNDSSS